MRPAGPYVQLEAETTESASSTATTKVTIPSPLGKNIDSNSRVSSPSCSLSRAIIAVVFLFGALAFAYNGNIFASLSTVIGPHTLDLGRSSPCTLRACWDWKPCLGKAFSVHIFQATSAWVAVKNCQHYGQHPPQQGGSLDFGGHGSALTSDPNAACLRVVSAVPCNKEHRDEFFRQLPASIGGDQLWQKGPNVLLVSMCDLTVTRDDRDAWLGKAAIAQNAVFRNNSIPEFDFALPLVALTQPSGATHEEKVNGQRNISLLPRARHTLPGIPKVGGTRGS